MHPFVCHLLDENPGEPVYIRYGGVPYPYQITPVSNCPAGVEAMYLLEDVGDPDVITSDVATTYFSAGTAIRSRWGGERHPVDGRQVFDPVDPRTLGLPAGG
jgi:hypothetical protein